MSPKEQKIWNSVIVPKRLAINKIYVRSCSSRVKQNHVYVAQTVNQEPKVISELTLEKTDWWNQNQIRSVSYDYDEIK